jgi:hypothetical protein
VAAGERSGYGGVSFAPARYHRERRVTCENFKTMPIRLTAFNRH